MRLGRPTRAMYWLRIQHPLRRELNWAASPWGGQEREKYDEQQKNVAYCRCLVSRTVVDYRNRARTTRLHRCAGHPSGRSILSAVERQMVAMGVLYTLLY